MNHFIIPLTAQYTPYVYRFLLDQEPWNMIPLDALIKYGLEHPLHHWSAEYKSGVLVGVLYQNHELLHFAYNKAPETTSPLYSFLHQTAPYFITHGKKELVEAIMGRLLGYNKIVLEECDFVLQSEETAKLVNQTLPIPTDLRIRQASYTDLQELLAIFKKSSIEDQIDKSLISDLIQHGRVLLAQKQGQIIGSIMKLKETPRYALLGGLFIKPEERSHGIASLLGQKMVLSCTRQGKRICFYYSDKELQRFYKKAAFTKIGQWVTYSATSKAMI